MKAWGLLLLSVFGLCLGCGTAQGGEGFDVGTLMKDVPAGFPRFEFAGHGEQATLLNHYLWYHFHNRGGNGLTLFNKEYLLTSDIWLGNASPRGMSARIQDVHRGHLLGMQMDDEGYVLTHQHFSHAHDHGWPFPMWVQSGRGPDEVAGRTAGWHFQAVEDVPGWVGNYLRGWKQPRYYGETAAKSWGLENVESLGIKDNCWHLKATGVGPTIVSPNDVAIDAFNSPYLQLRWKRTGEAVNHAPPYVEWMCEGDEGFGADRRVYFYPDRTPLSGKFNHSIMSMYRHPKWRGRIVRMRICLAPGESDVGFEIDSFFTAYDTRHTINNPIFILASGRYFAWTGDVDFLRKNINRMRLALRYQQTEMGGLKYKRIRNEWPGHDGIAGFVRDEKGGAVVTPGHGIGNNYWDLMPFGWDDLYATNQYYAATLVMADIEEAIAANPGWAVASGTLRLAPGRLRRHAQEVRNEANRLFWNDKTGRFIASIDKNGKRYDYGYSFLNLDAIWYGLADDEHARSIMDWLSGRRIVDGDTSTGADIYHWRFGPRATTLRNVDWYGQGWYVPEGIAWGGQVQDGGAVLGFSFYDLWARLNVLGPDDCWRRLTEILKWEREVHAEGGYRKYYEGGKRGTTLQGGGTAGGLGIDHEFYESSLVPSIVVYGFVGLDAGGGDVLAIRPRLPKDCPQMAVSNVLYRNVRMDISTDGDSIVIDVKDKPLEPLRVMPAGKWKSVQAGRGNGCFTMAETGRYEFEKVKE